MAELKINDSIRAKWYGGVRSLDSITAIVFHYTANRGTSASALGNARYFARGSEGRKASAHYVVDEGDVAKAWLCDKDAAEDKARQYWEHVAKRGIR